MKASKLCSALSRIVCDYGDRDLVFISVKRGISAELLEEPITTIKICSNDVREPVVLCGDSHYEVAGTPLIELNRLGRLLKRWIVKPLK